MSLFLAKRYTQPIKQVVDAAQRVAAGDLNQSIPVGSSDEIGQLSRSFNFMVGKLRESRTLEEKLREAENLSGLGQLSQSMAHEVRNPLNFINLSIDHIGGKYRPDDAEKQKKFDNLITGIKQEVQRLDKLVNDFLDYSRPIRLNLGLVNVEDLMEDVLALIWAKAEADGIRIVKEYSASGIEIKVDTDFFKSCVLNTITNAFHAMGASAGAGVLKIKTETAGNEFVLSITDNGSGVAPENLSKIFEPFFSTKQNGLGLGLPMTKRVMEEHNGRVEFESSEGKGSSVRLILPIQ